MKAFGLFQFGKLISKYCYLAYETNSISEVGFIVLLDPGRYFHGDNYHLFDDFDDSRRSIFLNLLTTSFVSHRLISTF